jgi:hypothetical protein
MQYGPVSLFDESPLDNPFGDEQRAVDFLPFLKHPKSRVPDRNLLIWDVQFVWAPALQEGKLPRPLEAVMFIAKALYGACLPCFLFTETMRLARRSYRAAKASIAVRGSWSPIWAAAARASAARPCQNAGSYEAMACL